jgi:PHD/YefM family antitoxin component YafN of YafNO toxin-antitoxin module
MRTEELDQAAGHLAALADEVENTGPILLSRPHGAPVVVVSAQDWERASAALGAAETAFWRQETAERARAGEPPGAGEEGPGLDAEGIRARYARLLGESSGP